MSMALTVARTVLVSLSPMPAISEACARAGDADGGSNAAPTSIRQAAGMPIEVIIRFGDNSIMLFPPRFPIGSNDAFHCNSAQQFMLITDSVWVGQQLLAYLVAAGAVEDHGRALPRAGTSAAK
jgi:hypothetical protein